MSEACSNIISWCVYILLFGFDCTYILTVACWAVVLFVDDRDFPLAAAQQFVTRFTQVARDHGMAITMTQVDNKVALKYSTVWLHISYYSARTLLTALRVRIVTAMHGCCHSHMRRC
jgi:hypothetical protein